jgi:hypothetical protein
MVLDKRYSDFAPRDRHPITAQPLHWRKIKTGEIGDAELLGNPPAGKAWRTAAIVAGKKKRQVPNLRVGTCQAWGSRGSPHA